MSIFNRQQRRRVKLNKFDLSHERKLSLNMGKLIPIMCQEILPGDKFRVNTECFIRFAPMIAPMMHRVNVFTHYFFVPNRLLWDEWEDFITGGKDGTAAPVWPHMTIPDAGTDVTDPYKNYRSGSLADYLGLPTYDGDGTVVNTAAISALPFRAYQLIFNSYYRDQTLTPEVDFSHASGNMNAIGGAELDRLLTLRDRAWEKDYFTSALPWAQRGGAVSAPAEFDRTERSVGYNTNTGNPLGAGALTTTAPDGLLQGTASVGDGGAVTGAMLESNVSTQINELRKAFRLQEWLERNARGGARYIEQLLAHFGVISSDARLQRPEYLGGSKTPVVISEVLSNFQFSGDAEGLPQGNMAGHGISAGSYNGFRRRFEEHGYVIGVMSVLPRTAYQQGINRAFTRSDKFDYPWPEFANIGEQDVKLSELYKNFDGPPPPVAEEQTVFGYQMRYAECKYAPSTVHGDFRTNLAYWHMARIFSAPPVLNDSFVTSDPTQRIFAVTDPDVHKLYAQVYNRVDALRPLPYFGNPSL